MFHVTFEPNLWIVLFLRESDDDDDFDDDEHHDILFCSFNSRDAGFVLPDLPCKN